MNGDRVHSLLNSIMKVGFSERKAEVGIVMDIAPERRAEVLEHNRRICVGDGVLPAVDEENALFTVLHTNHFTMIARCFLYKARTTAANEGLGITTPDGRLSLEMLEHADIGFYNYIKQGHRAVRVKAELSRHPALVEAIVASSNRNFV